MEGIAVLSAESSGVTGALTTGITAVATDAMSAISSILPIALPVLGAIVVIGIGIKTFKKVSAPSA